MSNLLHTRVLFTRSNLIKTYKLTDLFELAWRSTLPMDMAKHMSPLEFWGWEGLARHAPALFYLSEFIVRDCSKFFQPFISQTRLCHVQEVEAEDRRGRREQH